MCAEVRPNRYYDENKDHVPLFDPPDSTDKYVNCYNTYNEYNEFVLKAQKYCTVEFQNDSYASTLLLVRGNDAAPNEALDYQEDHSDDIDVVESVTLTGGPQNPFETIKIQTSKKRITSAYPDVQFTDSDDGQSVTMGSSIVYAGAGLGEYYCTAYSVQSNTITIEGHSKAANLATKTFTGATYFENPMDFLKQTLTTTEYGLDSGYTGNAIISNVWGNKATGSTDPGFTVSANQAIWTIMQYVGYMLHARVFFTGRYAYLIDYTAIGVADDKVSSTSESYRRGNRLLIRDALDAGNLPSSDSTVDNSLECHGTSTKSRISTRLYGSVEAPKSSETSICNEVEIRFTYKDTNNKSATMTLGVGYFADGLSRAFGIYTKSNDSYSATSAYNDQIPVSTRDRTKASIDKYGEFKEEIDLTQVFQDIPPKLVACIIRTLLDYRFEAPQEVSFTAMENYAKQTSSTKGGEVNLKGTMWSAMFPTVCAVPRFTDREQDLVVSSKSPLDGQFHYEKTYLAKYVRKYPDYMTTYTFGTPMSTTLSASINQTKTKISSIRSGAQ